MFSSTFHHYLTCLQALLKFCLLYQWWKSWKTLPVLPWIIAAQFYSQKNYREAARYYRQGLRTHPKHRAAVHAALDHAYCLWHLGEGKSAHELLSYILERGAKMKGLYLLLAKIQSALGENQAAADTLELALEQYPQDVKVLSAYAQAAVRSSASAFVVAKLKRRIKHLIVDLGLEHPKRPLLCAALACIELYYGREEQGEQLISRVLAADNPPIEAVMIRALWLYEQGRYAQARRLLERAFELSPYNPLAPALLARLYLIQGGGEEAAWAVQLATVACRLSFWENADNLEILVTAYQKAGDEACASLFAERERALRRRKAQAQENSQEASDEEQRQRTGTLS